MATTAPTDSELRQAVLDEPAWAPSVDAPRIGVAVKDGSVVRSGYVPSDIERFAAKRVRGIKAVVNEIDVRLPESNQRTDEDIARDAVRALKWNLFVLDKKIKVTVSDG